VRKVTLRNVRFRYFTFQHLVTAWLLVGSSVLLLDGTFRVSCTRYEFYAE